MGLVSQEISADSVTEHRLVIAVTYRSMEPATPVCLDVVIRWPGCVCACVCPSIHPLLTPKLPM